jgi:hypothetical protein
MNRVPRHEDAWGVEVQRQNSFRTCWKQVTIQIHNSATCSWGECPRYSLNTRLAGVVKRKAFTLKGVAPRPSSTLLPNSLKIIDMSSESAPHFQYIKLDISQRRNEEPGRMIAYLTAAIYKGQSKSSRNSRHRRFGAPRVLISWISKAECARCSSEEAAQQVTVTAERFLHHGRL